MSIYNPSQDSILWAHNIAQQDCEVIEDTLETMVIDSEFAERLCALVAIIKSGESSFGEWDCELAGVIQEILDDNKNLEFLGQGSYSSCFADSNNNVYKINLHVEAVDPWLSYAEICMSNNKTLYFQLLIPYINMMTLIAPSWKDLKKFQKALLKY